MGLIRAMSTIHILLIDDHPMFRTGLNMVLQSSIPNAQVLEAGSLEEAMRCASQAPDVLLLDIQMEGVNGLAGIAPLKHKWPKTPIVILSADASTDTVQLALERGANAFISKADSTTAIIAIIEQMLHSEPATHMSTGVRREGASQFRLTARQCEVLDLLSQGFSNRVIGQRLGLSENTVRGHVQSLLVLLRASSRSEAVFEARRQGLLG